MVLHNLEKEEGLHNRTLTNNLTAKLYGLNFTILGYEFICKIYIGFPKVIRINGPNENAGDLVIELKFIGIEAHTPFGNEKANTILDEESLTPFKNIT